MDIDQKLNPQEEEELRMGQDLYEMVKTPGFQHLKKMFEDQAYHSWVDPRETNNEKEFLWRELNAFHAANNAREVLEWIAKAISTSEYLEKKKNGQIKNQSMKI